MKPPLLILITCALVACSTTTTTTTVHTDGKRVVTVTEKKVDGNVVTSLSQLVAGSLINLFGNKERP